MRYYQKKTINLSRLENVFFELTKRRKYKAVEVIGVVLGRGYNDVLDNGKYREYRVRRLDADDFMILEQFVQTKDENIDDFIISKQFDLDHIPANWAYHIMK